MGDRRRRAIDEAVQHYSPPNHKLDFAAAEEIRHRFAKGEGVSSLARHYEVPHRRSGPFCGDASTVRHRQHHGDQKPDFPFSHHSRKLHFSSFTG
jgi:hypothetical protein